LALFGLAALARRGERFVVLWGAFTLLLLLLVPWQIQFPRYLMPTLAVLAPAFLLPLELAQRVERRVPRAAARAVALAAGGRALMAQAHACVEQLRECPDGALSMAHGRGAHVGARPIGFNPDWVDFERATEWLDRNAAPGDVVATAAPHYLW